MTLSKNPIILIAALALAFVLALVMGLFISESKLMGIALIGAIPFAALVFYYFTLHPGNALNVALIASFLAIGLTRYTPAPVGLTVDLILALGLVVALLHPRYRPDFKNLNNELFILSLIWSVYCILQLFNPEAISIAAWFYASRGVFIYMILTVFLSLLYYNTESRLNQLLVIIGIFSILAAIWGIKQYLFGPSSAEWAWLQTGPYLTHVLFGKLRIFSFFSDAGQFGAGMGHTAVIGIVLACGPFSIRYKIIWAVIGVICLYLMVLSGTRGALSVPLVGIMVFLLASKNFKVFFFGLVFMALLIGFLKFSTAGQNIYEIRRLRTALDPEDPSLNVRLDNQKKYAEYLTYRPFGGGIGSTGSWGKRFSPHTFLAETPTDSWYVKIWGETGIIGLVFHLGMLGFILIKGFFITQKLIDPGLRFKIIALYSGFAGIAVASYGNPLLGQLPTGTIIYISWSFIFLAPMIDKEILKKNYNIT